MVNNTGYDAKYLNKIHYFAVMLGKVLLECPRQ